MSIRQKIQVVFSSIFWLILVSGSDLQSGNRQQIQAVQETEAQDPGEQDEQNTNALINETSPYLLMHARNPVNWYAWNEESLAKSVAENKPIFLSVGYSSCHWCHVMERESFLDPEIAAFLNKNFICIKVDREERPDVDSIYMESLHSFHRLSGRAGGGGWPLSMFLTPDGRPFLGGTYFPARTGDRGASAGFLQIVQAVNQAWTNNRARVEKDADAITADTRAHLEGAPASTLTTLNADWIGQALFAINNRFDPEYGGYPFSPSRADIPKFPQPSSLLFLASVVRADPENEQAISHLEKSCQRMMMGGIYDHLGGGFHRYSVDRFWRIPHFEKMLYDNGQLASVYAELFSLTGKEEYRETVQGILSFVDRELTSPEGGFYAALDAESEGVEGKFYRWTREKVQATLNDEEYELFARHYGLNAAPNFEGEFYAPQLDQLLSAHAASESRTLAELQSQLAPIRQKLFDIRSMRERPLLDTKILTSWNGMMIRGYADAGRSLENEAYIATAARAADFAHQNLLAPDGRLWRTSTGGESKLNAYLDDYANLIDGYLALHRATNDNKWLERAVTLQAKQDELFVDETKGGYFFTSSDHEKLLVRGRKPHDGALPSGNSVSANNLVYLARHTDDPATADALRDRARKTVLSVAPLIDQYPLTAARALIATQKLLAEEGE